MENKSRKLALKLNCRTAGIETLREEREYAKENGLIIIYGSSDDRVEFEGSINDELNDGMILIIPKGEKVELYDEDEDLSWSEGNENTTIAVQLKDEAEMGNNRIEAEYTQEGIWRFKTDIAHHTFNIFEDGELFCVGMVIEEKDLN